MNTLRVLTEYGDVFYIDPTDEPRIDAAVSSWLDSGGTKDTLLSLTPAEGGDLKLRASCIYCFYPSTTATRRRWIEIRAELEREAAQADRDNSRPWE